MAKQSDLFDNVDTRVADAGAFDVDKNVATIGGYACLAAGSALALGVGAAVAPAPVLGLTALGGGLVVAGNIEDVKAALAGGKAPLMKDTPNHTAGQDVTDGGKYADVTADTPVTVSAS